MRGAQTIVVSAAGSEQFPENPSTAWQHKKVGVLGMSADIAAVAPEIVQAAQQVTWFQWQPFWIVPCEPIRPLRTLLTGHHSGEGHYSGEGLHPWVAPFLRGWFRAHLYRSGADRWIRRQMQPRWFQQHPNWIWSRQLCRAMGSENSRLLFWPLDYCDGTSVRSVEGIRHHFDVLLVAPEAQSWWHEQGGDGSR